MNIELWEDYYHNVSIQHLPVQFPPETAIAKLTKLDSVLHYVNASDTFYFLNKEDMWYVLSW